MADEAAIAAPTSRSARIEIGPKASQNLVPESMELQLATLRSKRRLQQGCIRHDDVYR
jgi:hypothetical protein